MTANSIFVVERGRYDELGVLMVTAALISLILPIITVLLVNPSRTGRTGKAPGHLGFEFSKIQ